MYCNVNGSKIRWKMITIMNAMRLYSPLIKAIASELIKWLDGFWMDAMAKRGGWTPSVIHTQQRVQNGITD